MSSINVSSHGAEIKCATGTVPAASAAGTVNGSAIDRQGFDWAVVEVATGAVTGSPTTQTLDVKLQHSDSDSSGFADLTGAAVTQLTAASSRKRKTISLKGAKRYIRAVAVTAFSGGSTPTLASSSAVILGGAAMLPAQSDD